MLARRQKNSLTLLTAGVLLLSNLLEILMVSCSIRVTGLGVIFHQRAKITYVEHYTIKYSVFNLFKLIVGCSYSAIFFFLISFDFSTTSAVERYSKNNCHTITYIGLDRRAEDHNKDASQASEQLDGQRNLTKLVEI